MTVLERLCSRGWATFWTTVFWRLCSRDCLSGCVRASRFDSARVMVSWLKAATLAWPNIANAQRSAYVTSSLDTLWPFYSCDEQRKGVFVTLRDTFQHTYKTSSSTQCQSAFHPSPDKITTLAYLPVQNNNERTLERFTCFKPRPMAKFFATALHKG